MKVFWDQFSGRAWRLAVFPLVFALGFICPSGSFASGEKDYETGDYEKAQKYYEEQAGKNPGDYKAQYNLGNSLYGLKRYDEASDAYEKTLGIKPDFEYGWCNLGLALAQQNKLQDSIEAFQKALEIDPKDEDAAKDLAIMKKRLEQAPKKDKSDGGGKYKNWSKKGKGGESATPTPLETPPPARKKDEKEDENSKQKRGDPDAKKKGNFTDLAATPQADPSRKQGGGKGKKESSKDQNSPGESQQPGREQKAQQRQAEQQRRDQAKKELGLDDKQIEKLMSQIQQQEEQTQQFYSADPKKDRRRQNNTWNFLPRQQQDFMRQFFGKPEKEKEVQEDW